jgi:hypothetical protein
MVRPHVIWAVLILNTLCATPQARALEMRGTEAAAISVAVERFKKIYARPDLRHYSVETERHGQELAITFVSEQPQTYAPGEAGTGGGSRYGPDMTYVVSLTSLKVLRFNFYR